MNSETISVYLKAGFSCLQIVTHEEERAATAIALAAINTGKVGYGLWNWTVTTGLTGMTPEERIQGTADPIEALKAIYSHTIGPSGEVLGQKIKNRSIIVMRDLHMFLKGGNPVLVRLLKECIMVGRPSQRVIIILGCQMHLPPELEKEITVIEAGLPTRDMIEKAAKDMAKSCNQELNGDTDAIIEAGLGLTTNEFLDAAAKSVVETGRLNAVRISALKAEAIKKGGILEVVSAGVTLQQVGGLDLLKEWIGRRKNAFSRKARDKGLPVPKGICLSGIPGCGKSFATRAIASELGCPLIRLDAGKLFGGIVGSSEANTRQVIQQVEAFGQCVLMVDEIDKGFSGMVGGHDGDNGTTRRVIGTFLTWMQEKTSPVFIVATANDLTRLPPELLRKGRWDELFFIDLPNASERAEIWKLQAAKFKALIDPDDLKILVAKTEGWTGAEIEAAYVEALYSAFSRDADVEAADIIDSIRKTKPLSVTMSDQLKALRKWCDGRLSPASSKVEGVKAN